jgi:hypothetical protein
VSERRRLPDPTLFYRLTGEDGDIQRTSVRERGGSYDALAAALDEWLDAARRAYAASDFETVQRDLANVRALYGELTHRMPVQEFGTWTC